MSTIFHLNWADFFILAAIAISVLVGLFRGFVREVLSLIVWIVSRHSRAGGNPEIKTPKHKVKKFKIFYSAQFFM